MFNLNRFSRTCCLTALGVFMTLNSALHAQPEAETIIDTAAPVATKHRLLVKLDRNQALTVLNGRRSRFLIRSPQPGMEWRLFSFASEAELEQAKAKLSLAGIQHEPDYLLSIDLTPNDPRYSEQWGLHNTGQDGGTPDADIDAPEAWDITTGSSEIVVAVIDGGIDYTHPDLDANIWMNSGEIPNNNMDDDNNGYVDDIHGANFITFPPAVNPGDPLDDNGHGTHVAGIVGAVSDNNQGVAGVNHQVRLMALKFINSEGTGLTSDAVTAIDYAIAHGAHVINASWGGGAFLQSLQDAIQRANDAGILFVASAGNSAANNDITLHYPSSYDVPNVVAVAATDRDDALADFNIGGSNFGAMSVDLGAPGKAILSTLPNNMYDTFSGTSMAAPHVAGTAALLLAQNSGLTPQQLKANLMFSGDPNTDLSAKTVTGRRLNAHAALTAIEALPQLVINDVSVIEGDSVDKTVVFNVGLLGVTSDVVTVDYATMDGSATAGSDYQAVSGTLTFAAGEAVKEISVTVISEEERDAAAEENFIVTLSNASNAQIQDDQGEGIIQDNDQPVSITAQDITINEGDNTSVLAQIEVTVTGEFTEPLIIGYATVDGSATANEDYLPTTDSLTFTPLIPVPGSEDIIPFQKKSIFISLTPDTVPEPTETVLVNLSLDNPSPDVELLDDQATITILDDDGFVSVIPEISVGNTSSSEGNQITFTVSLSEATDQTVTVDYTTQADTAVAGEDFIASSGTLMFTPGDTSEPVRIDTIDDALDEAKESFNLILSNPSNATLADATGKATINDNDDKPIISVLDATTTEGDTVNVTLQLDPVSGKTVTVDYTTLTDTAVAGEDFTADSGSVIFMPGETERTIAINTVDDAVDEPVEQFQVELSNPNKADLGDAVADIDIIDNDAVPVLSITDVSVEEGETATVTVNLNNPSALPVSVSYATADGSAVDGDDYAAVSGLLEFAVGETELTIDIDTVNDAVDENTEAFSISLSDPANATLDDANADATVTIIDDDDAPNVSIADASVTEGETATVTVSLSAPSALPISVTYTTVDGSALASDDYTAVSGTLEFAVGETEQTIDIDTVNDAVDENAETFTISLSDPANATLDDANADATVTITDNDVPPNLNIADVNVTEGETATVTVSLSSASELPISVTYTTADGSALAGIDYTAATGVLDFAAGETELTIDIDTADDAVDENAETFTISLSDPANATLDDANADATVTITDNDVPPNLNIADVNVTEGETATVTVSLSSASELPISVTYTTADGSALAGIDYTAATGVLDFAAGETELTIDIDTADDALDENAETFTISLSDPANATLDDANADATVTITDNDVPPNLNIADVNVTEGETATVTVSLSSASALPISVTYTTVDGSALVDDDYTAAAGTLNFAAGETEQTINIDTADDALDENAETFTISLSDPTNASLDDTDAIVTITDDDDAPNVSIADASVTEGGTTTVTVSLSSASALPISVNYTTADGSALVDDDYTAATGTLNFAAGETEQTIDISTVDNDLNENPETFSISLSEPTNATLGNADATVTISDDDAAPSLSIDDVSVTEGETATVTVSLSSASALPISVDYATTDGSAVVGDDYTAATGTLNFAAGETERTIDISTVDNGLNESLETFSISLSEPTNATLSDADATLTITDDDDPPIVNVADATTIEGQPAEIVITLDQASGNTITIDYTTVDATAAQGQDYQAAAGSVTFLAGETQRSVIVNTFADLIDELDEQFVLQITNASNATIGDATADIVINDDTPTPPPPPVPTISIAAGSAVEGEIIEFIIQLSEATSNVVLVSYATQGDTAVADEDFVASSGVLEFAAGVTEQTLTIETLNDALPEDDEQFFIILSAPEQAQLADQATAIATLLDDNDVPQDDNEDDTGGGGGGGALAWLLLLLIWSMLSRLSRRPHVWWYAVLAANSKSGR